MVTAQSRSPRIDLALSVPADDSHGSRGRQLCRRHELYVSFQDLGWLVLPSFPSPKLTVPTQAMAYPGRVEMQAAFILFCSFSF
jgi:hypothetical protein